MSRRFPWTTLGIDQTQDTAAIRRAYADALRAINVDADIAGYAALRRARDEALWLAAHNAHAHEDGDGDEDGNEGDFGLGIFDDDAPQEFGAEFDADFDAEFDGWAIAPDAQQPELYRATPSPELTETQAKAQGAWQALTDILYPGGEPSDDSVTFAEMEEGLAHLGTLLAHAETADLAEHDALDSALADLFARTWPRCAPFIEPANAALHWLGEAGNLEERPPLMFLNARLKGMRFHDKVQQSDHPLHKAWTELSRPGRASIVDRLRIKRLDIDKLLTGLRQHYPELENHLDPERVLSWEGSTNSSGVSDTGPRWIRGIVIVLLVLAVPRLISSFTDPAPDDPLALMINLGPSAEEIDAEIDGIFGERVGMAGVRAADPVFADQLRDAFYAAPISDNTPLVFARRKALEAGEVADFKTLVTRAELRRLWLGAAARQPAGVCENVLVGDFASIPIELTEEERARERPLMLALLNAKVLSHETKGGQVQYAIPGWVVGDVITRSGLNDDAVRAAMSNTGDANRCRAEIALVDVVLANPGRVSKELLRGL